MRTLLLLLIIYFPMNFIAQIGTLKINAFTNISNNLSDNFKVDSTLIRTLNMRLGIDTTFWLTQTNNNINNLKTGSYKVICTVDKYEIRFDEVKISSGKITILNLLFEPKKKLGLIQRNKRKKLFDNY